MAVSNKILITGASGLIGTRLTELLMERGDEIYHLGRTGKHSSARSFVWNIEQSALDRDALKNVTTIIHLAGAGVAEQRWTKKRKGEIRKSRVQSTRLLYDALRKNKNIVDTFISASAIGYYGFEGNEVFTEQSAPGSDFLADVTRQWELAADQLCELGIRVVKLRIGIVLSQRGGALKKMITPIKIFAGAPLGTGDQYLSWIHIDDLCRIFIKAIDDPAMHGAYNAVALKPVTNREMIRAIAKVLHKPLIMPAIPSFVLKIILGEMAEIVVSGNRVSADKILQTGFNFKFPVLEDALKDIFKQKK